MRDGKPEVIFIADLIGDALRRNAPTAQALGATVTLPFREWGIFQRELETYFGSELVADQRTGLAPDEFSYGTIRFKAE
jgi:hypothetical protein